MTPYDLLWTAWLKIRYARQNFLSRRKWRNRPEIGDLILEDGTIASWMHCCDYPERTDHDL